MLAQYPHNSNVIIFDMMNLRKEYRETIRLLARDMHYDLIPIVFNYDNKEDYTKDLDEQYNRRLIFKQLRFFKTETMPTLSRRLFRDFHTLKSKDFSFEVTYPVGVVPRNIIHDQETFIISDIHECIETFKALLVKRGFTIEDDLIKGQDDIQIILNGDWIDKGRKTRETIEFIYKNKNRLNLIVGNHENFVYKYFKDEIPKLPPQDLMDNYFTSIKILEQAKYR